MASLYTDVLYVRQGLLEGTTDDIPCPAGKRMVVRSVDCAASSSAFTPLVGFEDLLSGGTWLAMVTNGILLTSQHWEGYQAFNVGGGFRVNAHVSDWDLRVTGWLLDVP
jgi:hypothetical protein